MNMHFGSLSSGESGIIFAPHITHVQFSELSGSITWLSDSPMSSDDKSQNGLDQCGSIQMCLEVLMAN